MSDRHDHDAALDDELRGLLHRPVRAPSLPPFAMIASRTSRTGRRGPVLAAAALAVLLLFAIGPRLASLVPASSSTAPTCEPTGSALDGPFASGPFLWGQLDSVRADPGSGQLLWTIRMGVRAGAPASASIQARARVLVTGRDLAVVGYELTEPSVRTLATDERVSIEPCRQFALVLRTAGQLPEGTFSYSVSLDKVLRPEGDTTTETFTAALTCSPTPFTCAPAHATRTATPSASPSAVLNPSFGVIYQGRGTGSAPELTPNIRREGSTTPVVRLIGNVLNQFIGAVAPDGRRIAYFAQPQGDVWNLYVLEPKAGSQQVPVTTLRDEHPISAPLWSSDGQQIAFAVADQNIAQGTTPAYTEIRTVDLAQHTVRTVARRTDHSTYQLVGWDKSTGAIAALVISPVGTPSEYALLGPLTRSWALNAGTSVVASTDGRVAIVVCEPSTGCALRTTTLTDFGNQLDVNLGPGLSIGIIGFRPGTSDLALLVSPARAATTQTVELWSAQAGRREVLTTDASSLDSAFFRADGSALVVGTRPGNEIVVDLRTGQTARLADAQDDPFARTRPVASVGLD